MNATWPSHYALLDSIIIILFGANFYKLEMNVLKYDLPFVTYHSHVITLCSHHVPHFLTTGFILYFIIYFHFVRISVNTS
jgi:hypothetical protein